MPFWENNMTSGNKNGDNVRKRKKGERKRKKENEKMRS
jgi:hypothetical protein